jgi:hypothetical protein
MSILHKFEIAAFLALLLGGCCRSCSEDAAGRPQTGSAADSAARPALTEQQLLESKHPLAPAWKLARDVVAHIEKDVRDYTAVLVSRERFDGKYVDRKTFIKVRHQPFSVYFRPLEPASSKGDEAIYVEGKNNGEVLAHTTGVAGWLVSTFKGNLSLDPKGSRLMKDQHYPMTEVGILNLARRLKDQAAKDMRYEDCEVTFTDVQFDGRPCTCVTVVHPQRCKEFLFYKAKVYVDKKRDVPLCYESFDWPEKPGKEPQLIERYEYRDLKLNPGLTDLDFDVKNPKYDFSK